VSSFEYLFVNGVPRWGSGGLRMAFLMLSSKPCLASSVRFMSRRQHQSLY
jgi:aryl carrier-like protein